MLCFSRRALFSFVARYARPLLAYVSSMDAAAERLEHWDGPYLRTDGSQIAANWDNLVDGALDVRAVLRRNHRDVTVGSLPNLLRPAKGTLGLIDYEKAFCLDPTADVFDMRGIANTGCMVVVRPDQHVAHVLPLNDGSKLAAFFDAILVKVDQNASTTH